MSVIPKISVGLPKRREKFQLNFDNSTTSNIGNIQPTMCREMVPGEKFSVKVSSLVRLASMPLPTFGRISLRHNHVFVSYRELYEPFDAMLSAQHYRSSSSNFVPTQVPYFNIATIIPYIMAYSDITIYPKNNLDEPLRVTRSYVPAYDSPGGSVVGKTLEINPISQSSPEGNRMTRDLKAIEDAVNAIRQVSVWFGGAYLSNPKFYPFGAGHARQDDYGMLRCGDVMISYDGRNAASFDFQYLADNGDGTESLHNGNAIYDPDGMVITPEGADLITTVGDYMLCLKFKAPIKRLRTIFIGLGYTFSPYDTTDFSVLKLFAYYKGWFSLFRPNREKSFTDTNCYACMKYLSERNGVNAVNAPTFTAFIEDLIRDCYYYLPMDYFSMAVLRPQQPNTDLNGSSGKSFEINAGVYFNSNGEIDSKGNAQIDNANSQNPSVSLQNSAGALSPLVLRLAQRLLTYANKNTVIGRNIRDYLKVHYGVADVDPIDSGDVIRIGSSRVNVNISDVMSTAESSQGYLGEYGGKGIGYGDSDKFSFTADKFGCWITYTVIVPESGYYQGYLKENRHMDRYTFFMPEFDALGYQVLEKGEIMSSYDCDSDGWNPYTFNPRKAFGFVPRYSEYKIGRNIVNGDLSLIGLKNSMSPYTLDRRIPSALISSGIVREFVPILKRSIDGDPIQWANDFAGSTVQRPDFVPSVVYDDFRRIDPSDHLGQYNRIFNYGLNDLDHFIIHNIFNVDAVAPMKSLTTSFDTYGEEDDTSVSITKA